MRINAIQSYNNYNRIGNRSVYTGNKCYATKVTDSVAFGVRTEVGLKYFPITGGEDVEDIPLVLPDSESAKDTDAAFEALKAYFAENFLDQDKVNDLTPESSLQYDVGLDSTDLCEFRMDLEHIVGDAISDKEFAKILTLNDVTNFMTEHKEAFSSDKKALAELHNLGYSELLFF